MCICVLDNVVLPNWFRWFYLNRVCFWKGAELPDFLLDKIRVAYTGIFIVDIVKWVIIVVGLLLLASAALMLFHRDKLWCFAETHVAHFSENGRPRPDNNNPVTISNSDNYFNSVLAYPSNPQLVNRNVKNINNDRFLPWVYPLSTIKNNQFLVFSVSYWIAVCQLLCFVSQFYTINVF